jgi:hypothetical protein
MEDDQPAPVPACRLQIDHQAVLIGQVQVWEPGPDAGTDRIEIEPR